MGDALHPLPPPKRTCSLRFPDYPCQAPTSPLPPRPPSSRTGPSPTLHSSTPTFPAALLLCSIRQHVLRPPPRTRRYTPPCTPPICAYQPILPVSNLLLRLIQRPFHQPLPDRAASSVIWKRRGSPAPSPPSPVPPHNAIVFSSFCCLPLTCHTLSRSSPPLPACLARHYHHPLLLPRYSLPVMPPPAGPAATLTFAASTVAAAMP